MIVFPASIHCVLKMCQLWQKKLASNYDKHGLILIFFPKQHQHTFKNNNAYSTFLVPSFLLALFAFKYSSYGNDTTLCSWNSPAPSAKNTGFYLCRSVYAKQSGPKPGWLQNLGTNVGMRVHCTNTWPRYQRLEAAHHWHMGKHITKRHRQSTTYMHAYIHKGNLYTANNTEIRVTMRL